MSTLSLVLGIVSLVFMLIGLIPCLGWLNWFILPIALIGVIVSAVTYSKSDASEKTPALVGLILSAIVLVIGGLRLIAGGGIV